jgi:hypothetical protein
MSVEIGAEAPQFPEKEYINGISVAVYDTFADRMERKTESLPQIFALSSTVPYSVRYLLAP